MSAGTLAARPPVQFGWTPLYEAHGPWTWQVPFYGVLFFAALAMTLVDDRTLFGISVWIKPAKFALSLGVYYATLAWVATLLPRAFFQSREGRALTWVAIVPGILEILYIFFMAALQQQSHYNTATPLTSIAYGLMGIGAVTLVSACVWLATAVMRRCAGWWRDPLLLGVVLGLVLSFALGGGFGGVLSSNATGHWVGGEFSDASGTAIFGWSTTGGDLRVAHFFGMHAMQVLPFVGWLVRGARFGVPIVLLITVLYSAVSVYTFLQALDAQPLL